ncbi:Lipoxygenase [Ophiobolus disseminans]|uniref:Manganese lipoxygenase n=1 Tax=Ophiobolus disseminans TaxID=1469910 RepID=A0A6A6ZGP6_9PLEO|nr:Lipoxygenase [Ophiobolus disseminans]
MAAAVQHPLHQGSAIPSLGDILSDKINHDVEADLMSVWDKGVFLNELFQQGIVLSAGNNGVVDGSLAATEGLTIGTYQGTRMALTEVYKLIEEAAVSHYDSKGFEPIIPKQRDLKQKKDIYNWSQPSADGYPPHLQTVPADLQNGAPGMGNIFDLNELAFLSAVGKVLSFIIPDSISHRGTPYEGPTLADCEKARIWGFKDDWYSDARFAQQHLSGVNPSTIEKAPAEKVKEFIDEADKQGLEDVKSLLFKGNDLFVQDYSYFRKATGLSNTESFQNIVPELDENRNPTGKFALRYACAPIVLFQLHSDGRLHPLAITLDYKGSLADSVTIFNKRLSLDDQAPVDEKHDWPWRYAKTCAQTADWVRHEISTHLVDTHMIEETIIVATNRTIPDAHIIHEILSPHWFRTLALNAAARAVLVPAVMARVAGLGPSIDPKTSRVVSLVNWSYSNFDFVGKYIPNDLKARGFDLDAEGAGEKYRNYPYATDMRLLWGVLRSFVESVIGTRYESDEDVQNDACIGNWCEEIQGAGQIPTFPTITTREQLVDAITMCIHTASPQHTAVNYLQDYYYSFVPAKPAALCTPLPSSLAALAAYTEHNLTAALPIGGDNAKWKDWLLAAQLPELLSYKVDTQYSLITYAKSLYNVNKKRTAFENEKYGCAEIKEAARVLYSRLKDLGDVFERVSENQTGGSVEYRVLQPEVTAVSILI